MDFESFFNDYAIHRVCHGPVAPTLDWWSDLLRKPLPYVTATVTNGLFSF